MSVQSSAYICSTSLDMQVSLAEFVTQANTVSLWSSSIPWKAFMRSFKINVLFILLWHIGNVIFFKPSVLCTVYKLWPNFEKFPLAFSWLYQDHKFNRECQNASSAQSVHKNIVQLSLHDMTYIKSNACHELGTKVTSKFRIKASESKVP